MPLLCLSFRCCNVLVIAMPMLNCAKLVRAMPTLGTTLPMLRPAMPRQCFARQSVASAPIVAVAGDCSAVPTHCSPMPMLCFGFRPCRTSLRHCLAEHNFSAATLSLTSLCLGYAVHACATTELCFAIEVLCCALPSRNRSKLCLAFAIRSVALLCPRDSKLRCATARQWTACHRRSFAYHLSALPTLFHSVSRPSMPQHRTAGPSQAAAFHR